MIFKGTQLENIYIRSVISRNLRWNFSSFCWMSNIWLEWFEDKIYPINALSLRIYFWLWFEASFLTLHEKKKLILTVGLFIKDVKGERGFELKGQELFTKIHIFLQNFLRTTRHEVGNKILKNNQNRTFFVTSPWNSPKTCTHPHFPTFTSRVLCSLKVENILFVLIWPSFQLPVIHSFTAKYRKIHSPVCDEVWDRKKNVFEKILILASCGSSRKFISIFTSFFTDFLKREENIIKLSCLQG